MKKRDGVRRYRRKSLLARLIDRLFQAATVVAVTGVVVIGVITVLNPG